MGAWETKHDETKFLSIEESLSLLQIQCPSPISLHHYPSPRNTYLRKIIHFHLRNATGHKARKPDKPLTRDLAQVKGPRTLVIVLISQFSEHHAVLSKPNLLSPMPVDLQRP